MMTKTVQSVTVHSMMQLIINAKQSGNGAGEIEVEPFFGKVFSHPRLSFFVFFPFVCCLFQYFGEKTRSSKLVLLTTQIIDSEAKTKKLKKL